MMLRRPHDEIAGLVVDIDERVLVLRLSRPEVHNAFNMVVVDALRAWLTWAGTDRSVGAVVLTGTDPSFSSGADFREMDAGGFDLRDAPSLPDLLRDCRVPTLCALNGPAHGGGATVPLAADLRVASPRASLSFHFAQASLLPEGGATSTLQRIVGRGRALDIILSSRTLGAADCHRLGLVEHVVEEHAGLMPYCLAWGRELARAPFGMADEVKRLLSTGEDLPFAAQRKLERRAFAESVRARLSQSESIRSPK